MVNTKHKTISIALATYNGAKYLSKQLDSILHQTLLPCEVIIVDDSSTDNTWDILLEYQSKYSIIKRYRNEKNSGVVASFNSAIMKCSGDYIALCDQDDIWLPNKLEILVNNIENYSLIHSDARLIDSDERVVRESHFEIKDANKKYFVDYLWTSSVHGCTAMFKRDLVYKYFPIADGVLSHDQYVALCAMNENGVKLIIDKLVLYRQHTNNVFGASKSTYDRFLQESYLKSSSYIAIKNTGKFTRFDNELDLISLYRLSLSKRKIESNLKLFDLLKLPNGYKYVTFLLLMTVGARLGIARFVYNLARKIY